MNQNNHSNNGHNNSMASGGHNNRNSRNQTSSSSSTTASITSLISKLQQSFTDAMSTQKTVIDKRTFEKTYKNMDKVGFSFQHLISTFKY